MSEKFDLYDLGIPDIKWCQMTLEHYTGLGLMEADREQLNNVEDMLYDSLEHHSDVIIEDFLQVLYQAQ
jgi:hypothetical protein